MSRCSGGCGISVRRLVAGLLSVFSSRAEWHSVFDVRSTSSITSAHAAASPASPFPLSSFTWSTVIGWTFQFQSFRHGRPCSPTSSPSQLSPRYRFGLYRGGSTDVSKRTTLHNHAPPGRRFPLHVSAASSGVPGSFKEIFKRLKVDKTLDSLSGAPIRS